MGPGRHVDPLIGQDHEDQRDVEGHHGAGQSVRFVHHEDARRGVTALAVAPLLDQVVDADAVPALHYG